MHTVIVIALLGIIGYLVYRYFKKEKATAIAIVAKVEAPVVSAVAKTEAEAEKVVTEVESKL